MKLTIRPLTKTVSKLKTLQILYGLIGIFLFSIFFYIYKQEQNSVYIYVTALLSDGKDIFVAAPYWVANTISKGTKDKSILGKTNAELIDVETYEGGSHGKHVILRLKLSAIKDRFGSLYYKNQQLEVNKWLDLKLGQIDEKIYVVYLGAKLQDSNKHRYRIIISKKSEEPYVVNNLKVNDEMVNNKGEILAKIISLKSTHAEIRSPSDASPLSISYDPLKKDLLLEVDILTNLREGIEYFGELRKLRAGESINLFFPQATLWDAVITSVMKLNQ
ncbi:hypothetical protein A2153_04025 [Candidatus Gottesmanbacteria bacterium RBG_16_38_7b]|uniref:Uncharacterized protein n=1 Tax=Candidatus Gottesmanbacteria bacterium RBG_16_38_7b TaxID=1798372 RepID=A0A1F5YIL2_9BACT|nr:MAG: hypothetical protein A2153_04025 [Candidatus Gottesmanbacteria bacterium RBG_16_38_7b]